MQAVESNRQVLPLGGLRAKLRSSATGARMIRVIVAPALLFCLLACGPLPCLGATGPPRPAARPVKVIFDTDMDSDCDDVGALAVLHALADRGEAEILA